MAEPKTMEEVRAKWSGALSPINAPPKSARADIPPQPQSMEDVKAKWGIGAQSGVNAPPRGVSAVPNLGFQEREARRTPEGEIIPIDFESGIGVEDYDKISGFRTPEDRLEGMKRLHPGVKGRVMGSGDVAIEVTDLSTGKPKEIVLNPHGMNAHDLLDISAQYPEIAAMTITAIATQGRGLLKTGAQILASAFAGGVTGAARDAYQRAKFGMDIRPGEIATERTKQALLDAGLEGVFGVLGKASKVLSPYAGEMRPGSLEFNLQAGREFFKDKTGIDVPVTEGQRTGSLMLQAVEEAEFKQPGARNVAARKAREKQESVWKLQDIATSKRMPDEEIGQNAIEILRNRSIAELDRGLEAARAAAKEKGNKRVLDLIDKSIGVQRGATPDDVVTKSMAGAVTGEQYDIALKDANDAVKEAYDAVKLLPGGSGDILSGDPAAKVAANIRKEIPRKEIEVAEKSTEVRGFPPQRVEVETGATTTRTEQLKSGVPEGIEKALSDLEGLKGAKVSLDTITKMKNAMFDEIAKVEAVPGVKDKWFSQIAGAYEKILIEAEESTASPKMKAALKNARETYKTRKLPFDKQGLREIARSEFDPGHLSDESIFNRMFEGPNAIRNYNNLKEVLGANNPAFGKIKRAWSDWKLTEITDPVTGDVDPFKMENLMVDLKSNKRELFNEMFGKNSDEIFEALRVNQTIKKSGPIQLSEIRTLLNLKDPTVQDAVEIFRMQERRNKALESDILRDIADGFPISQKLPPSEFSSRLANTKVEHLREILGVIERENPEIRQAIADTEFYKLLDKAAIGEAETATRRMQGDPVNFSAKKLQEAIGLKGTKEREKIEAILGPEKMEWADNFIKILAPEEKAKSVFGGAGGLSQSQATLQMLKNPLKYAKGYTTKFLFALGYTNPAFARVLANRMITPERAAMFSNILIASEPFVSRLAAVAGPEQAQAILDDAKQSMDRWWTEYLDSPQGRESQEAEKMLQGQPAKVQIKPTP